MRRIVLVLVLVLGIVGSLMVFGCTPADPEAVKAAYVDCFIANYRAELALVPPDLGVAQRAERVCLYPSPPKYPSRAEMLECREQSAQQVRSKYGDLDRQAIRVIEEKLIRHLTASMCLVDYRGGELDRIHGSRGG